MTRREVERRRRETTTRDAHERRRRDTTTRDPGITFRTWHCGRLHPKQLHAAFRLISRPSLIHSNLSRHTWMMTVYTASVASDLTMPSIVIVPRPSCERGGMVHSISTRA